jgi:YesN/AraC family two-component response regulator
MNEKEILKKARVLYVEDDAEARFDIAQFIRRRVAEIYEAANGKEGLELYEKHKPDLVITDIQMPIMNGMQMIDGILGINLKQPVIITTGYDDDKHKSNRVCLNLIKPIDFGELESAMIKCIIKWNSENAGNKE